jgi:hypothetical protein
MGKKKNKKQIGGYMIDGTLSRHFLHPLTWKKRKKSFVLQKWENDEKQISG